MAEIQAHPKFLAKLDEMSKRYDAITDEMGTPEVASNAARLVKLSREHAALRPMVEAYRLLREAEKQARESQALRDDPSTDAEMRELAGLEVTELEAKAASIMENLIDSLIAGDEATVDSIIVEIRAGTGGDEAAIFAGDLLDMYTRYAAIHGFKVEVLDSSEGEQGGFREVVFNVKGPGVYTFFGYEAGGHRVQRVPLTETQGRIHTSAATVAVLPEIEETEININWEKDVLEHVSRAGGPGGQNVNKVSSAIKLEHVATGITVSMRDEKSQHKNRAKARRILASRIKQHFDSIERAKRDSARKTMIGSGDRSERIRTYNFPQNRCTDHRVNENYSLEKVVRGEMDPIIDALRRHDRQLALAGA